MPGRLRENTDSKLPLKTNYSDCFRELAADPGIDAIQISHHHPIQLYRQLFSLHLLLLVKPCRDC